MNQKVDKRKLNRIQGGWAKSTEKKNIPKISGECEISSIKGIQFDNDAVGKMEQKCIIKEISKDITLDLNSYSELEASTIQLKSPANIQLINDFIAPDEKQSLFDYFLKNLQWEQRENTTTSGVKYLEPRKTCWFGLPYSYSKVKMPPNVNWDPKLLNLLNKVQEYSEKSKPFNSVMCNLYMGAKNSIDWHADDEKSLGKYPTIASVSLGSTRAFELCQRSELFTDFRRKGKSPYRSRVKDEPPFEGCSILYRLFLEAGSLLIMSGAVQNDWLHRVPKEYHDQEPRINFTFRYITEEK